MNISQNDTGLLLSGAILIAENEENIDSFPAFESWIKQENFGIPISESDWEFARHNIQKGNVDASLAMDAYREFVGRQNSGRNES